MTRTKKAKPLCEDDKLKLIDRAVELAKAQMPITGCNKDAGEYFKKFYHDLVEVFNE